MIERSFDHEALPALMDAAAITNRRARCLLIEVFNLSNGCSDPFQKTFEQIGSRMVGSNKSTRAKANAVSYALARLGRQPLLCRETKNVTRTKKQSTFTCNWNLVERALEIQQTLSFSPQERQESFAEAARLALESSGFFENTVPASSKAFRSTDELEARVRKNKATIKTLIEVVERDVHALGFSPNSDLFEIQEFINQRTRPANLPAPFRGSLRNNIKLSVAEQDSSSQSAVEIGEIEFASAEEPETGASELSKVKIHRVRSSKPQTHALAELNLYRAWGLRSLKKAELNATDECQEYVHKFPLTNKRLALEVLERANSNCLGLIVRPPHIVHVKGSGIAIIHLDDLPLAVGTDVVGYFGGILKETSKDNYQVLFPVYGVTYSTLFRQLSRGFIAGTAADPGANGATRLCGSLNIKPIHENRRGQFPVVRAAAIGVGRMRTVPEALASPFYCRVELVDNPAPIANQSSAAWIGDIPNIAEIEQRVIAAGHFSRRRGYEGRASQSHVHFRFLCALALRMIGLQRLNRDELRDLLLRESPSARTRSQNYINRTIEKAIGRVQRRAPIEPTQLATGAAA